MKTLIIIITCLLIAVPATAQNPDDQLDIFGFTIKPTLAVPWGKIEQASAGSNDLSARLIAAIGGGATFGKYKEDYQRYGFSALLILDAMDGKDTAFSPSAAVVFNIFNQKLQGGIAYNFGSVRDDISRWYLLFSIGVKLPE